MARSDDFVARGIRGAGFLILWGSMLASAWIVGVQSYNYLKTGVWLSIGVLHLLGESFHWAWGLEPSNWIGLHGLINTLNAGVALAIVGGLLGLALIRFEDH